MKLKFTQDYSGRETAMKEYRKGDEADISNAQALALIKLGVAKEVWASIGAMYDRQIGIASTFNLGDAVLNIEEKTRQEKAADVILDAVTPDPKPQKPRKGKVKK